MTPPAVETGKREQVQQVVPLASPGLGAGASIPRVGALPRKIAA